MTKVKDLGKDFCNELKGDESFLHQYMTLTRCDLYFADKAILIEGTSERLLLPKMIEKVDRENPGNPALASQYISTIEVGGAYAHRFIKLLNFLELRTLIITDFDSVDTNGVKCKVSEGSHTSNACIKEWFNDKTITPTAIIGKSNADKTRELISIAYQVPENNGEPCGRSFEDAFMLANQKLFDVKGNTSVEIEADAFSKAQDVKKSEFAIKHAIELTEWNVPRYIKDGLCWLAGDIKHSAIKPTEKLKRVDKKASSTVKNVIAND